MIGLDNAGKTTLLYKLKLDNVVETIPTIGFNLESIQREGVKLLVWDIGGQEKIRALWKHYFINTELVIFLIDSTDVDRITEAGDEIHRVMKEDELRDALLLIFANKRDLPNALPVDQISERCHLNELKCKWHMQSCCAQSGEGVNEGFAWVREAMGIKTVWVWGLSRVFETRLFD